MTGSGLSSLAIKIMRRTCDEVRGRELVYSVLVSLRCRCRVHVQVMLETEVANTGALKLYDNLGFTRVKMLPKYYLNGGDAILLKLWFK
jgi:ribosomal protein S18 acetylase RimI-like enzyme